MMRVFSGDRLRQIRTRRQMTQYLLAQRLEVSQPTIARWEADQRQPRGRMLGRLSIALACPVDDLYVEGQPSNRPAGPTNTHHHHSPPA